MNPEESRIQEHEEKPGQPAVYTCPSAAARRCAIECRVGHSYSELNLAEAQRESLENALWVALRTLEEGASMAQRMAQHARARDLAMVATRWEQAAERRAHNAGVVREILFRDEGKAANE